MQNKQKKMLTAIAAGAMAVVTALTGTFAWQSISQRATNEALSSINPGGRLHDDFDGENKDVYVENFTSVDENGADIYARIRLDEYMEVGKGAGLKEGDEGYTEKSATPLIATTPDGREVTINDPSTWSTYIPSQSNINESADPVSHPFRSYYTWDFAGKTVYMPTFNMNKDSLEADINGTLAGTDPTDETYYDDYYLWAAGETKTGFEIWDADDNKDDELKNNNINIQNIINKDDTNGDVTAADTTYVDNVRLEKGTDSTGVTHTAKETLNSTVITMAEWIAMGSPIGEYWVYDVDGWAYWAAPIEPGTATGLLLDGISLRSQQDGDTYYAIHVVAQFASRGDWGTEADGTGFYDETQGSAPTADALALLNKVADLLPTVTAVSIDQGYKTYTAVNKELKLTASVRVENATGAVEETDVTWSIDQPVASFSEGTFIPTDADAGKTFRITATSVLNPEVSGYTDVYVAPADAADIVTGANNRTYIQYADNTYRVIASDGTVSEDYVSAGANKIIGDDDDKAVVLLADLGIEDTAYGTKFIGPNTDESYYAAGTDGLLGAGEDIKVWIVNGAFTITNPATEAKVDDMTLTAADGATTVKVGETLAFTAVVTKGGSTVEEEYAGVTWAVINGSAGTTISDEGELTVSDTEAAGTVLTIRATSKVVTSVMKELKVTVTSVPEELQGIDSITEGSTDTVTIDGIEWYVLARQDGKALLWAKDVVNSYSTTFGSNNLWASSNPKTYLNGTFLESLTTLKDYVADTTIYTADTYNRTGDYVETTQKVFLLSEADVFGTANGSTTDNVKEYTLGVAGSIVPSALRASSQHNWLRSPRGYSNYVALLGSSGGFSSVDYSYSRYLRPALWVTLES